MIGCGGAVFGGDGGDDGVVCCTFSICGDAGDMAVEVKFVMSRDSDTFIGVVKVCCHRCLLRRI